MKLIFIVLQLLAFREVLSEDSIRPIPEWRKLTGVHQYKAYLGQKLFEDKRLSADDTISCKSCHDTSAGGADRERFSTGINGRNIQDAIAFYETTLTTPGSRFDRYLAGDRSALTTDEIEGHEKFKSFGCISCHQGTNVGGNMYQSMGIARDYFKDRGQTTKNDNGLFNVTGKPEDRHVFKVPSLRMVAHTAPYFHDGSAETLEKAIQVMGRYQLGRELSSKDIAQIKKFLQSLAGKRPTPVLKPEDHP